MSDDTEKPEGTLRELEIHINLRHPELLGLDGKPDRRRVGGLLRVMTDCITESAPNADKGVVLDGEAREPLGYWLLTFKDGSLPLPEDD